MITLFFSTCKQSKKKIRLSSPLLSSSPPLPHLGEQKDKESISFPSHIIPTHLATAAQRGYLTHQLSSSPSSICTVYITNQQRNLNKLPTELQYRNFVGKHRLSMQIGALYCLRNVYYIFWLSFHFAYRRWWLGRRNKRWIKLILLCTTWTLSLRASLQSVPETKIL